MVNTMPKRKVAGRRSGDRLDCGEIVGTLDVEGGSDVEMAQVLQVCTVYAGRRRTL